MNIEHLFCNSLAHRHRWQLPCYVFCGICGIPNEIYESYKKGYLKGDVSLSPSAFLRLSDTQHYYLFMIVLQSKYQKQGIGVKMYEMAMQNLSLYSKNISIVSVCNELSKAIFRDFSVAKTIGHKTIMIKE